MISSTNDIKKFVNDKKFKKIFLLCGEKSLVTSGADNLVKNITQNKKIKIFYKNSFIPIIDELIKIIFEIRKFQPDLILAIGGGTIIDYAKIANVIELKDNLTDLIVNYSYPFKKIYQNCCNTNNCRLRC